MYTFNNYIKKKPAIYRHMDKGPAEPQAENKRKIKINRAIDKNIKISIFCYPIKNYHQ